MNGLEKVRRAYRTTLHESRIGNLFSVTFVPRDLPQHRGSNGAPKPPPQYVATVQVQGGETSFNWEGDPPADSDAKPEDFIHDVEDRLRTREEWLGRISDLVDKVELWAKELGWSTRRVEKKFTDSQIGNHVAPALLMQEETSRVLLEPISRFVPGADGLVDLYLMPAYDDIASLLFREGEWHLQYLFPGSEAIATAGEATSKLLSKDALQEVLQELKKHGR